MRIIRFPQPDDAPDVPTPAELEASLHGDAVGPSAEYWRDLRADVRALAPPLPPGLEQRLRERIEERHGARRPNRRRFPGPRVSVARARRWLAGGWQRSAFAGIGITVLAAIITLALVGPWNETSSSSAGRVETHYAPSGGAETSSASGAVKAQSAPLAPAALVPSAPARVQQRAATLTLAAKPDAVQSVSDQVAQLAVREGGIVQSSHVQLQSGAAGEANLELRLPSARLSTALASLGRLAPLRAESQSLQDITDEYDAAKRKLADAVAERQALLRALAHASTQGEIESLRARLALAGGAITRARIAFQSVSKRGSSSTVEVTVLGNAASSGGLTLSGGLHDAGDVLRVALAVLIVALAVLVPLAALVALSLLLWRASRRRLRERALS